MTMITQVEREQRAALAAERAEQATARLAACDLCPRHCRVDRLAGALGACRVGALVRLASYAPHFGEEPPLVGRGGSGTVFFAGCNLRCLYCQNHDISQTGSAGLEVSCAELAAVFCELQARGCENLNLVTPSHVLAPLLSALSLAWDQGLAIPVVYNCGGYESVDALALLDGLVDIYLPDIKYGEAGIGMMLSDAPGYARVVRQAVKEMHRQVGDLVLDDAGRAVRGLMVRHLVLPEGLAGSAAVARFLAEDISRLTYVNVMDQYRPEFRAHRVPELNRRPTEPELAAARAAFRQAGLHHFAA